MAKISCDPEVFVGKVPKDFLNVSLNVDYKVKTANRIYSKCLPVFKEEPIPICGLIGGTKEEPILIPGAKDGYLMQEDGTALEFNVPPVNNGIVFAQNVQYALTKLHTFLFKLNLVILPTSTAVFSKQILESYPQAMRLGCSPDYDAYKVAPRKSFQIDNLEEFRFAGGHIHMSFTNKEKMPNEFIIRLMDIYLGLPTLGIDKQGIRRKFYGQAGLFRPTKYPDATTGVEYRTLSNFWIFDRELAPWIGTTVLRILNIVETNPFLFLDLLKCGFWSEVPDIIREEDYGEGKKIIDSINNTRQLPWYPEMWGVL